jgi:hypothetical protein
MEKRQAAGKKTILFADRQKNVKKSCSYAFLLLSNMEVSPFPVIPSTLLSKGTGCSPYSLVNTGGTA